MTLVVSLVDYAPSPRYDGTAWTQVQIQEGTASAGPWTTLETQNLSPVDPDPSDPAYRNFTTALGTAADFWYRLIFLDALGSTGLPTYPVQNTGESRPVYASISELAQILRVSATDRHAALRRVLESAAAEIDSEIGTADISGTALPYGAAPALVSEVNLERAVEHWKQMQAPYGIVGMGDEVARYVAKDTWTRHALKLAPYKASWGLA